MDHYILEGSGNSGDPKVTYRVEVTTKWGGGGGGERNYVISTLHV